MDMVDIASPTGGEIDMARYLVDRLGRAGIDSELQFVDENRPNAIGHLHGRGEGLPTWSAAAQSPAISSISFHVPSRRRKSAR